MKHRLGDIRQYLKKSESVLKPLRKALSSGREIEQILLAAKSVTEAARRLAPDPSEDGADPDRIAKLPAVLDDAPVRIAGTVNAAAFESLTLNTAICSLETLTVDVGGKVYTVTFGLLAKQVDSAEALQYALKPIPGIDADIDADGALVISGHDAETFFKLGGSADIESALGIARTTYYPTNLLTQGVSPGDVLEFRVGGGEVQTITFGTGRGEVSTLAKFRTELARLSGIAAMLDSSNRLVFAPTSDTDTVTLSGREDVARLFRVSLGEHGPLVKTGDASRALLQAEYNALLLKIDTVVQAAESHGADFLSGGDQTVAVPDDPKDTYTVTGHDLRIPALGLTPLAGREFQSDQVIDGTLAAIGAALDRAGSAVAALERDRAVMTMQANSYRVLSDIVGSMEALKLKDLNQHDARRIAGKTKSQLTGLIGHGTRNSERPGAGRAAAARGLIGQPKLSRVLLASVGETDVPDAAQPIRSA